jgi:sugar phosphate permease
LYGSERKRWLWKLAIGLTLIVGYAGYYVCRSNLSVASPSLIKDLDIDKSTFGTPLHPYVRAVRASSLDSLSWQGSF